MQWLLYLLCPLMMLFCLLPMLKGSGKKGDKNQVTTSEDLTDLKNKMAILMQQNQSLTEEIANLKALKTNKEIKG